MKENREGVGVESGMKNEGEGKSSKCNKPPDAPTDGTSDHEEAKASNQTPKPSNQELKDVVVMFGSPRTMVEDHGQTVVRSASPRVLDPEMGHLCWILSLATGLGWRQFWYSPKA